MNPLLATDGYKTGHHLMYPDKTELVYSNFTPRSDKHAKFRNGKIVVFGTQMTMIIIDNMFRDNFFNKPKNEVIEEIKNEYSMYLGYDYDTTHFEKLWDLQYLPIHVKALPEGSISPIGIPVLTIKNTHPEFAWLTNFLETLLSNLLWKPMTSATIANKYKSLLDHYAMLTDTSNMAFVGFQGHDFSMRGIDGIEPTIASALGHAISFIGSDSLPSIYGARKFYRVPKNMPIVHSVNASEHAVMSAGIGLYGELETYRNLIKKFPSGILSLVSDTMDLWKVMTQILPALKEDILKRDGKLVIRPDSGDPADIICGKFLSDNGYDGPCPVTSDYLSTNYDDSPAGKGVIQLLYELFGGEKNKEGYIVLNAKIGAIYGDSITLEKAQEICEKLMIKGFATTNVVLGIGSYTYQFNTRDTYGFAMKATYVEIDGKGIDIYKDPVTDSGTKKSAKGLLYVGLDKRGEYYLEEQVSKEKETQGELMTIYKDGNFFNTVTLEDIRNRLK